MKRLGTLYVAVLVICSSDGMAAENTKMNTLKIFLGETNSAPYDETATAPILMTFNSAVLGRLLTVNPSFELEAGLLERWHWNYQTKSYDLTLRKDIIFHNERRADAKDLEFALLRGFFTKHRSFYKLYLSNIVGIEDAEKYRTFVSGVVSGVKIIDEFTVRVHLKVPNPTFLYAIADPYFSLVVKEALQDDYIRWKSVPIGAGPYKVIHEHQNGKTLLQLNDKKNFQLGSATYIELYTKKNKNVDYDVSLVSLSSESTGAFRVYYSKYPSAIFSLFFCNLNPLGKEEAFRKAIQVAINRSMLNKDFEEEYSPAYEMLPRHFWGREDIEFRQDLEKARSYLSFFPKSLFETTWKIPVFSNKSDDIRKRTILERLKKQFSELGLKVEFYSSHEKFISEKVAKESPISIASMVADYVDPSVMFSAFREETPFIYERPYGPDATFEKLYHYAERAENMDRRLQAMRALSEYFNKIAMAVPLFEEKSTIYVNEKSIETIGKQDQPLYLILERIKLKNKE